MKSSLAKKGIQKTSVSISRSLVDANLETIASSHMTNKQNMEDHKRMSSQEYLEEEKRIMIKKTEYNHLRKLVFVGTFNSLGNVNSGMTVDSNMLAERQPKWLLVF